MKHLIQQMLVQEKIKQDGDKKLIQELQQKLDSELTIKDLIETGRITTRVDFEKSYVSPPSLDPKCKDVMVYIGKNYIQMLSNGYYLFDYPNVKPKRAKKLETVEEALFNHLMQNNVKQ